MTVATRPLLDRLADLDTTSIGDADPALRTLSPLLRPVAAGARMAGRAVTADARDDLVSVLAALRLGGPGDVLVLAGGSPDRALLGELFATEAVRRGMVGIVIDGCCRDSAHLASMGIPVFARGRSLRAAGARRPPVVQVPVLVCDVQIQPGDILVGDDDGVLVGSESELLAAVDLAEEIQRREQSLRAEVEAGTSLLSPSSTSRSTWPRSSRAETAPSRSPEFYDSSAPHPAKGSS
jgi:4-hydroxy-4-methyl-2-oxoglutarate aldolase